MSVRAATVTERFFRDFRLRSLTVAALKSPFLWESPQYTRSMGRFSLGRMGVGRLETS